MPRRANRYFAAGLLLLFFVGLWLPVIRWEGRWAPGYEAMEIGFVSLVLFGSFAWLVIVSLLVTLATLLWRGRLPRWAYWIAGSALVLGFVEVASWRAVPGVAAAPILEYGVGYYLLLAILVLSWLNFMANGIAGPDRGGASGAPFIPAKA